MLKISFFSPTKFGSQIKEKLLFNRHFVRILTKFSRYHGPIDKTTLCFDEVVYVPRYLLWNMAYCFPSFKMFLLSTNATRACVNIFGTLTRFYLNLNFFSISSLAPGATLTSSPSQALLQEQP